MKKYFLILSLLLLTSCAGVKTDWNFNQGKDFSNYKTYSWLSRKTDDTGQKFNDLVHSEVVRYIEDALESKGFKKAEENKSDVHINYMININHKTINKTYNNFYSTGGHPGFIGSTYAPYGYYGVSGPYYTKRMNIEEASFVIDILDKQTRGIAWRGHASKTIDRKKSRKKQLAAIKSAIDKLFRNYPPKR